LGCLGGISPLALSASEATITREEAAELANDPIIQDILQSVFENNPEEMKRVLNEEGTEEFTWLDVIARGIAAVIKVIIAIIGGLIAAIAGIFKALSGK